MPTLFAVVHYWWVVLSLPVMVCGMHCAFKEVLNYTKGLPAEAAANQIVKEVFTSKALREDTTCIVVDILPPENLSPPLKRPREGVIKALFCRRPSDEMSEDQMDKGSLEPHVVEEIYEESSTMLVGRRKREHFNTLASLPEGPLLLLGDWLLRTEL